MAMPSRSDALAPAEKLDHHLQAVVQVIIHPTLPSSLYGISCRSIEHLKLWWASACIISNAVYHHPTPNVFRIISTNGACPDVPGSLGVQFTAAARLAPNEVPFGHPQHRGNDLIVPIKDRNGTGNARFLSMRYVTPNVEIVQQQQQQQQPPVSAAVPTDAVRRAYADVDLDDTLSLPSDKPPSLRFKHYDHATGGFSESEIYSCDSDSGSDASAEADGPEYYASDSEAGDATGVSLRTAKHKKHRHKKLKQNKKQKHAGRRRQPRTFAPEGAPPTPRPLSPMDESDILAGASDGGGRGGRDASLMDVDTSEAYQAQAWIDANDEANACAFDEWMADQRRRRHKQIVRQRAEEREEKERRELYLQSQLLVQRRGAAARHGDRAGGSGRPRMQENVRAGQTRGGGDMARPGFPALYQVNPNVQGQMARAGLGKAQMEAQARMQKAQVRAHMEAQARAQAEAQKRAQVEAQMRAYTEAQAQVQKMAYAAAAVGFQGTYVKESGILGPRNTALPYVHEYGYARPGEQPPAQLLAHSQTISHQQALAQQQQQQQQQLRQAQSQLPQANAQFAQPVQSHLPPAQLQPAPPVQPVHSHLPQAQPQPVHNQPQNNPANPPPTAPHAPPPPLTPASSAAAWSAMCNFPPPASLIAELDRQGIPAALVGSISQQVRDHLNDKLQAKVNAVGLAHVYAARMMNTQAAKDGEKEGEGEEQKGSEEEKKKKKKKSEEAGESEKEKEPQPEKEKTMPPPPPPPPKPAVQLPQVPQLSQTPEKPQDKPKRTPLPTERPPHTLPDSPAKTRKVPAKKLNNRLPR